MQSQATFVHIRSYRKDEMLALGGNTSNSLYNVRTTLALHFSVAMCKTDDFGSFLPFLAVVHRAFSESFDRLFRYQIVQRASSWDDTVADY